ncbi:MAG: dihydrolipoamide dehydrogenase [Candidatus Latescibacterota bacterium]|jgi:dihydrolipoamide dehydrogenase
MTHQKGLTGMDFDVVIIGGGSGGYAAARTAQALGAKVGIIDKGPLGGLCILRGCMPTKTILRSSDVMSLMKRAKEFGLRTSKPTAKMDEIYNRKKSLIKDFADYRIEQLNNPRFKLIRGKAQFLDKNTIKVGKKTITSRSFVIGTGSVVAHFDIPGLDEVGYITSDEALELKTLPKSMIVLGGGAVATEFAQFFCRVGCKTTLIQRSNHIFSSSDEDLARPVEDRFREEGMKVFTGTQLIKFTQQNGKKVAHFKHEGKVRKVTADIILQALGRKPAIETLGLENAGVQTERGNIVVDKKMQTSTPSIYAVGDCNGIYEVVHIAIQQGEIAGHNAVKGTQKQEIDYRLKSEVVFTDPQYASVGLTEKESKAANIPYKVASYPFNDHGKSLVMGETHGFVKILCNPKSGEIIGAQIVGPEAGELIHELIAVMYFRGTVQDLARIPHYHPTLSEIITYPAEDLAEEIAQG